MKVVSTPIIVPDLSKFANDPALPWRKFRPGIQIYYFYQSPGAATAALLRYAPGASLERHIHVGMEQIYVLSGSQIDDNGEHFAGALLIHLPGTGHAIHSPRGCVVLALWEKPVRFAPPNSMDTFDEGALS